MLTHVFMWVDSILDRSIAKQSIPPLVVREKGQAITVGRRPTVEKVDKSAILSVLQSGIRRNCVPLRGHMFSFFEALALLFWWLFPADRMQSRAEPPAGSFPQQQCAGGPPLKALGSAAAAGLKAVPFPCLSYDNCVPEEEPQLPSAPSSGTLRSEAVRWKLESRMWKILVPCEDFGATPLWASNTSVFEAPTSTL